MSNQVYRDKDRAIPYFGESQNKVIRFTAGVNFVDVVCRFSRLSDDALILDMAQDPLINATGVTVITAPVGSLSGLYAPNIQCSCPTVIRYGALRYPAWVELNLDGSINIRLLLDSGAVLSPAADFPGAINMPLARFIYA